LKGLFYILSNDSIITSLMGGSARCRNGLSGPVTKKAVSSERSDKVFKEYVQLNFVYYKK
jgi:hypothetical protein